MKPPGFRAQLLDRLGWSFGASALWTWGLLAVRSLRDGLLPLEVWFSYGLSFLMTAVYVYLAILIVRTFRAERGSADPGALPGGRRLATVRRPVQALGGAGLLLAAVSVGAWAAFRYPGPEAHAGTVASLALVGLILSVAAMATWIAWGVERRPEAAVGPLEQNPR